MAIAIEVDSLSKKYRLGEYQAAYGTLRETLVHAGRRLTRQEHHRPTAEIWALRDVSFQVPEGQVLGIIGRNGAGKSTLLKILTRIAFPTEGRAEIRGRVGSLLEVGTGFNQELTGRENVYLNGAILGMKRREIEQRFDDIIEFSGVERFIDTPVKRYSSGMYVRLAFAVAAHLEPEILFVDEVLSVGDAEFQRRCLGRMEELANTGPDGGLRLPRAAGRRPALRPRDLDRGRTAGRRRAGGRGDRQLPPPDPRGGHASAYMDRRSRRPGNDLAKIRAIRALGHEGMPPGIVDVRQPVGIEIEFDVLRVGKPLFPKIKVLDEEGAIAFNAMDTGRALASAVRARRRTSPTAWIPGNLLNEGSAIVEAAICSIDFPKLEHHAAVYEAVSFEVLDPGEGDSARGQFSGQWRGVVRPLLDWTCERV